jgi:hypothetical protein
MTRVHADKTTQTTATIDCSTETAGVYPNVVSGGFQNVGSGNGQFEIDSYPSSLNAWTVTLAQADNNSSWTIWALCAK